MDKPVMIFGMGPLTAAAIEIFNSNNIEVYGILDDEKENMGKEVGTVSVLGNTKDDGFLKLIGKKCEAFIAYDDNRLRKSTTAHILERRKVMPMNAVHKHAYISSNAFLGHGNFVNLGATLGAGSEIGNHVLLNANATIDHGCHLADYVQVGTGAIVGSQVKIGENAFIGSGAVIVSGITIGKNARIGAGSVVVTNVADNETVFGNPAQKVKG